MNHVRAVSTFVTQNAQSFIPAATLIIPYLIDRVRNDTGWVYDSSTSSKGVALAAAINTVALFGLHQGITFLINWAYQDPKEIEAQKSYIDLQSALQELESAQGEIKKVQGQMHGAEKGLRVNQARLEGNKATAELAKIAKKKERDVVVGQLMNEVIHLRDSFRGRDISIDITLINNLMVDDTIRPGETVAVYEERLRRSSGEQLTKIKSNLSEVYEKFNEDNASLRLDNSNMEQQNKSNNETLISINQQLEAAEQAQIQAMAAAQLYQEKKEEFKRSRSVLELRCRTLESDLQVRGVEAYKSALVEIERIKQQMDEFEQKIIPVGNASLKYVELKDEVERIQQEIQKCMAVLNAAKKRLQDNVAEESWMSQELETKKKVLAQWLNFFQKKKEEQQAVYDKKKKEQLESLTEHQKALDACTKKVQGFEDGGIKKLSETDHSQLLNLMTQRDAALLSDDSHKDVTITQLDRSIQSLKLKGIEAEYTRGEARYKKALTKKEQAINSIKELHDEIEKSHCFYNSIIKLLNDWFIKLEAMNLPTIQDATVREDIPEWKDNSQKLKGMLESVISQFQMEITEKLDGPRVYTTNLCKLMHELSQLNDNKSCETLESLDYYFDTSDHSQNPYKDAWRQFHSDFREYHSAHKSYQALKRRLAGYNEIYLRQQPEYDVIKRKHDATLLTINTIKHNQIELQFLRDKIETIPNEMKYEKETSLLNGEVELKKTALGEIIKTKNTQDLLVAKNLERMKQNTATIHINDSILLSLRKIMPQQQSEVGSLNHLEMNQTRYLIAAIEYAKEQQALNDFNRDYEAALKANNNALDDNKTKRDAKYREIDPKEKTYFKQQDAADLEVVEAAKCDMLQQALSTCGIAGQLYGWKKGKSKGELRSLQTTYENKLLQLNKEKINLAKLQCQYSLTPHRFDDKHPERLEVCRIKGLLLAVRFKKFNLLCRWRFNQNRDHVREHLLTLVRDEERLVHEYYAAKGKRGPIKEYKGDYAHKCAVNANVESIGLLVSKLLILQKYCQFRAKKAEDQGQVLREPPDRGQLITEFYNSFRQNQHYITPGVVKDLYTKLEQKITAIYPAKQIDFMEQIIRELEDLTGPNNETNPLQYIRTKKIPIIAANIKLIEARLEKPNKYTAQNYSANEMNYKTKKNEARATVAQKEQEYYRYRLQKNPNKDLSKWDKLKRFLFEHVPFFLPPMGLYLLYQKEWLNRFVQLSSSNGKNITIIMSIAHFCLQGKFLNRTKRNANAIHLSAKH